MVIKRNLFEFCRKFYIRKNRFLKPRSILSPNFILLIVLFFIAYVVFNIALEHQNSLQKKVAAIKSIKQNRMQYTELPEKSDNDLILKSHSNNLKQRCLEQKDYKTIFTVKDQELSHILVDLEHKFLYCGIPRAGELDWRRVFYKLSGKTKETNLSQIPLDVIHDSRNFLSLNHLSNAKKREAIREYKKIIITRNPFERILSIYQQIFEASDHSETIKSYWAEAINEYIRKNKSKSKDITFEEFLKFVLLIGSKNVPKELAYFLHQNFYLTMAEMCFPCNIQYNLIGTFENLDEDSNYVLKTIGADFQFPMESTLSETKELISKYYGQVEKDVMLKITQYYIKDMTLFGYSGVSLNENTD
jgi:chondroitin 4-sulfotransferase 11